MPGRRPQSLQEPPHVGSSPVQPDLATLNLEAIGQQTSEIASPDHAESGGETPEKPHE